MDHDMDHNEEHLGRQTWNIAIFESHSPLWLQIRWSPSQRPDRDLQPERRTSSNKKRKTWYMQDGDYYNECEGDYKDDGFDNGADDG